LRRGFVEPAPRENAPSSLHPHHRGPSALIFDHINLEAGVVEVILVGALPVSPTCLLSGRSSARCARLSLPLTRHSNRSPPAPVSAVGKRNFARQRQRPRNGPSNSIGRLQRRLSTPRAAFSASSRSPRICRARSRNTRPASVGATRRVVHNRSFTSSCASNVAAEVQVMSAGKGIRHSGRNDGSVPMVGFRTAWALPVSPTCLPNGQGSVRCSAFHSTDVAFKPSLYQRQSPP
jgi:hypothetical protein